MIDLFKHHNELVAPDQVRFDGCSAYGSIVTLNDAEFLVKYDCLTEEDFGIYVVRATISLTQ